MIVEVNMTQDDTRFKSAAWWAGSPQFVLDTLSRQLEAASAIWPELSKWKIVCVAPPTPDEPKPAVQGDERP